MECWFEDLKDLIVFYSIYKIPLGLLIQLIQQLELTSWSHFSSKIVHFSVFEPFKGSSRSWAKPKFQNWISRNWSMSGLWNLVNEPSSLEPMELKIGGTKNRTRKVALVAAFCCKTFAHFEFVTWSSWALESSTGCFPRASDSRDYTSIIAWLIQKVQNCCSKILQPMQLSERQICVGLCRWLTFIIGGFWQSPSSELSLQCLMPSHRWSCFIHESWSLHCH